MDFFVIYFFSKIICVLDKISCQVRRFLSTSGHKNPNPKQKNDNHAKQARKIAWNKRGACWVLESSNFKRHVFIAKVWPDFAQK